MCDTFAVTTPTGTLFAKNSDRPVAEPQLINYEGPRPASNRLATQYLKLGEDPGSVGTLMTQPDWLWGAETALSTQRVAIGNEKVWTTDDPAAVAPGLIGMDLVRLAAERATDAAHAVLLIGRYLHRYGQGGGGERGDDPSTGTEPYWSSFLIGDPSTVWQMETSGAAWVARELPLGGAISNRLTDDVAWDRSGGGADPEVWGTRRHPDVPTELADHRLACTSAFVANRHDSPSVADAVAVLRSHGTAPWGDPVARAHNEGRIVPPPEDVRDDFSGVSVCMHVRGYQRTTASLATWMPVDREERPLTVAALGSPCCSIFVPCGTGWVPDVLGDSTAWATVAAIADAVEAEPGALAEVRAALDPTEDHIWDQAAERPGRPPLDGGDAWSSEVRAAFEAAATALGVGGTS
ncbi:hypothetical protein [Candidatus Neomicrothrix sp.]|jgi:hypothetical protein|uniref:hypothetical protein n=1 Tax=Candidatus Neomicrothrix sp. TaxID=2719034 RepID=UPI001B42F8E1|nr:hypothetical protein [Candidatus Microthrix sp.]MBK6501357.1 hypothetical protein [Candidatus Microthrix sp.]MBK7019964.1 hypothetical protein [Candidatus Microthrix sp.]MBK7322774.1 hypothetical protein [Candidatus Microthrix sp.]MBL0202799.1 hypothetical protein [Candidatus Microthrix sp.]MBP7852684.1 hypothetical protein [Candidatus Microthrix sp.]